MKNRKDANVSQEYTFYSSKIYIYIYIYNESVGRQ